MSAPGVVGGPHRHQKKDYRKPPDSDLGDEGLCLSQIERHPGTRFLLMPAICSILLGAGTATHVMSRIDQIFRGEEPNLRDTRASQVRLKDARVRALKTGFQVSGAGNAEVRCFMLWTIFAIVLVMWILGFSFHIAGGLIHLLLVVALAILIFNLVTGRRHVL